MLAGWKTLITNGVVLLAALAAMFGLEIGADEREALIAGAMALVNIALRFATKGPAGPLARSARKER